MNVFSRARGVDLFPGAEPVNFCFGRFHIAIAAELAALIRRARFCDSALRATLIKKLI